MHEHGLEQRAVGHEGPALVGALHEPLPDQRGVPRDHGRGHGGAATLDGVAGREGLGGGDVVTGGHQVGLEAKGTRLCVGVCGCWDFGVCGYGHNTHIINKTCGTHAPTHTPSTTSTQTPSYAPSVGGGPRGGEVGNVVDVVFEAEGALLHVVARPDRHAGLGGGRRHHLLG